MNSYIIGSTIRVSCTFTVDGVATNPTTVTVKSEAPSGTVTTWVYGTDSEVVRPSTGVYYVDIAGNAAGVWEQRFTGTGTCPAVTDNAFVIDAGRLP